MYFWTDKHGGIIFFAVVAVPGCTHAPALSINVLTNPAMPDVVKIGMTNRDTIDARMKELFHTSVTLPFECEYACNVVDRENKPVKRP